MNRKTYSKAERDKVGYGSADLIEMIDNRIASAGDVPLYTFTDYKKGVKTSIMPGEFKEQYQAVSTWLFEKQYVRKNIAIIGDNSYEWILAMWGIICSNNVTVAIDKGLEEETTEQMLLQSDTVLVFYSDSVESKVKKLGEKLGIPTVSFAGLKDIVSEGRSMIASGRDGCFKQKLDTDDPALFVFTSGTTGKSKCVMLSQMNLISNYVCTIETMRLKYSVILLLPFHHVYGLVAAHFPYITLGKTIHINLSMRDMMRDIQAENPEMLIGVPVHASLFYKFLWSSIKEKGREQTVRDMIEKNRSNPDITMEEKRQMFKEDLSLLGNRLIGVITGGSPIEKKFYYGFHDLGIELVEGYGISECSPIIAGNSVETNKAGTVGQVLSGSEVMIEDPNEEGIGEICVKGPGVMLGYYKDEKATAEAMRGGWFHTGDLGYLDEEEYICITGRIKNLIILSNGENVSPEELENRIIDHDAVAEVVAYQKDDRIVAQIFIDPEYVQLNPDKDPKQEIRNFIDELNQSVAQFKQISVVEFRKEPFERNASKKIIRSSLEEITSDS